MLKVLWRDDDEMLNLKIAVSGGAFAASHETYVYPEQLRAFGVALQEFPIGSSKEVLLESGSDDPKWHDHMRLRAFLLTPAGQSALEVDFKTTGVPPASASCRFYVTGEPASFNRLGSDICQFVDANSDEMESTWRDA